jgi:hypothetical protein
VTNKTRWFAVAYGVLLVAVAIVGTEALASLFAPSWPARALRSTEPVNVVRSRL